MHAISQLVEPATYEQNRHDPPQSVVAMNYETKALEENKTWSMITLSIR